MRPALSVTRCQLVVSFVRCPGALLPQLARPWPLCWWLHYILLHCPNSAAQGCALGSDYPPMFFLFNMPVIHDACATCQGGPVALCAQVAARQAEAAAAEAALLGQPPRPAALPMRAPDAPAAAAGPQASAPADAPVAAAPVAGALAATHGADGGEPHAKRRRSEAGGSLA